MDGASQADFAQDEHAATERMHIGSTDLLSRLPFGDAVALAALVGTGQMSWPDINTALAARIKLAAAGEIRRRTSGERQWDENVDACTEWQEAKRAGESEIWARYHTQCDAVFADRREPLDAGWRSIELLFSRERILDRLRDTRDRALAGLAERLGPRPILTMQSSPTQTALMQMRLTAAEGAALGKLGATGFLDSEQMRDVIEELAVEIADTLG